MSEDTDAQKAQKLLQEILGLEYITDETELRIEINRKLESMNKIETVALKMKLGTKANELEAGQGFQDRKPKLFLATMLIMFGISVLSFWHCSLLTCIFCGKLFFGQMQSFVEYWH